MTKLFTSVAMADRRTVRYPLLLTPAEAEKIRAAANIRNLSVAEYIRRTALARKAEIRYETEIVLTLRYLADKIRDLVEDSRSRNQPVLEDQLRPVIAEVIAAMLRVSK
jgi:hypothetical protein